MLTFNCLLKIKELSKIAMGSLRILKEVYEEECILQAHVFE